MDNDKTTYYKNERTKKTLLPKGDNLKEFYVLIDTLCNAKISDEEIVEILRNVNAKLAQDILFSYRLKTGNQNYDIVIKLGKIYLQEYIEDYNNNKLKSRLSLRTTNKRPRVITREEIMYAMFQKNILPPVIFNGYNGDDEIVKSLVDTGKTVFERRKTEAIYDRIEASLKDDMNYVVEEINKTCIKSL